MICLRCGYCCDHLDVMIVDPRAIRADGTIDPQRTSAMVSKPSDTRCPHLEFRDGMAACTIHELACYQGSPCQLFVQFGPEDDICILGGYFRSIRTPDDPA
ncbi:MAG: hypothetical protein A4E45_00592 [Methanosaeta sp. PtaB.Bin039]|nr:MAG: hypothetical protein A4E45_00592 [Methanosaeta sp. PtaB.Bin039]HOT06875.1 YkgJ family cysteine cluster protein [Methanotrichaceae archaeon]HQF16771.1 YkgJ family cysteine cluster protein [Methanotrichaceae archaeon]HQI91403.1 YkgJ family cysteine cluster protein [Methanotrichaceae archaeon]HQJ28631.1 YkgJ family cysteine cluster protein [Methanotrichaceae archaeon]